MTFIPSLTFTDYEWFLWSISNEVACQQGTLTLPDTWFRPPSWDLLVLQLLRPDSSNLPCLYSTFHLEYSLVLSRFYFMCTAGEIILFPMIIEVVYPVVRWQREKQCFVVKLWRFWKLFECRTSIVHLNTLYDRRMIVYAISYNKRKTLVGLSCSCFNDLISSEDKTCWKASRFP